MRFSLKLLMLVLTAFAIAIGMYVVNREAELGIEIPVPTPVGLDDQYEIPATLLEIRSKSQVREHNWRFENSREFEMDRDIARMRTHMTWFNPKNESDLVLLKERRPELLEIARLHINDSVTFRDAVTAAWILERCDLPEGFQYIKQRFLEKRPGDLKKHYEFIYVFGDQRLTSDSEIVSFLKAASGDENANLYWTACKFLDNNEIDSQPLIQLMQKRAVGSGYVHQQESIKWLMEHNPNKRTLHLAKNFLSTADSIGFGFASETFDKNLYPEFAFFVDQAEKKLIERLVEYSSFPPNGGNNLSSWETLGARCSEISADFFRNVGTHSDRRSLWQRCEQISIACRALKRLGHDSDAENILATQIVETAKEKDYFDSRIKLFQFAEGMFGRDKTIEICKSLVRSSGDEVAVRKLAQLFEGAHDAAIVDLILNATAFENDDGSRFWECETLMRVKQIGSSRLVELWETLPDTNGDREVRFNRHWVKNQIKRKDLVDWINDKLAPSQKLKTEIVLNNEKYPGSHWVWHDVVGDEDDPKVEIDSDYKFATLALAYSGCGNLGYDDRYPLEGLVDVMVGEIADIESKEFVTTSHSYDWEGRSFYNSFVVNGRLYKFTHSEGPNGSDDRYSVEAACEILNTVAIRQRLKGRFFCYETDWGVTLAMYLTPQLVSELESKFEIRPLAGFEYYLKN